MPIEGLTIIAESINDSVPSTKKLFEANDIDGILALAKSQDEKGAAYIDVNVGLRSPSFMGEMIRSIQKVTARPLSIDTPDPAIAEAALRAYDQDRAGGKPPILNSVSLLRPQMLDLYKIQEFLPILLVSERMVDGAARQNHTAEETWETAKEMLRAVRGSRFGLTNDRLIFDPGIAPIGADSESMLARVLGSMKLIHDDPDFAGVHISVGLSNFTVMLPPKRADGSPVKGPLESAFLTLAMPLGLDMIIGSMVRKYELLAPGNDALVCLQEVLQMDGFDTIQRVKEFYR